MQIYFDKRILLKVYAFPIFCVFSCTELLRYRPHRSLHLLFNWVCQLQWESPNPLLPNLSLFSPLHRSRHDPYLPWQHSWHLGLPLWHATVPAGCHCQVRLWEGHITERTLKNLLLIYFHPVHSHLDFLRSKARLLQFFFLFKDLFGS